MKQNERLQIEDESSDDERGGSDLALSDASSPRS